jgi:hypothetical protein
MPPTSALYHRGALGPVQPVSRYANEPDSRPDRINKQGNGCNKHSSKGSAENVLACSPIAVALGPDRCLLYRTAA